MTQSLLNGAEDTIPIIKSFRDGSHIPLTPGIIKEAIVLPDNFSIEASQHLFNMEQISPIYLYDGSVVDLIRGIAEKSTTELNSVCTHYPDFGKDYKEIEKLADSGLHVPGRSTMLGWLNNSSSSVSLLRYHGEPCLMDSLGNWRPLIPDGSSIIKLIVLYGINRYNKTSDRQALKSLIAKFCLRFCAKFDPQTRLIDSLYRVMMHQPASSVPVASGVASGIGSSVVDQSHIKTMNVTH